MMRTFRFPAPSCHRVRPAYVFPVFVSLMLTASCSVKEEPVLSSSSDTIVADCNDYELVLPSELTIDFGDEEAPTKTSFGFEGGRMRAHWVDGDKVFACAFGKTAYGAMYYVPEGGAAAGTFVRDASYSEPPGAAVHIFYYPGDGIMCDQQFMDFSYKGQIQHKSDPTGHLSDFYSLRKSYEIHDNIYDYDVSKISFQGASQSGCMRLDLSGMTFENPYRIEICILSEGVRQSRFCATNRLQSAYNNGSAIVWPSTVESIGLSLEGYGQETALEAYLMHGCADVQLYAGDVLRVYVYGDTVCYADVTVDKDTAIKGGYYSCLSVSEGWKIREGDYTDYSWDGEVVTLQQKSGKALDVVIMGDGYIKEDFDNGTYHSTMMKVYDAFFSEEPYRSLKDCFNVYYVKTPSPQRLNVTNTGSNGGINGEASTKFSVQFTANSTSLSGNDALAREYAKRAFQTNANERIKDATVIVIANHRCHAGTCWNSWYPSNARDYGQASSVSFCALEMNDEMFRRVVVHEACGHGTGKLADEYTSTRYYTAVAGFQNEWNELSDRHNLGLFRNVDKYVTPTFNSYVLDAPGTVTSDSEVLWYDLINTANHYEWASVESLGFYDGAYVYPFGFCRPTEASNRSIMYANTGIFNAISRRQILYRIRSITGQVNSNIWGTQAELDYFLQWDAANVLPSLHLSSVPMMLREDNYSEEYLMPYAAPVCEEGEWVDGVFVAKPTSDRRYVGIRRR